MPILPSLCKPYNVLCSQGALFSALRHTRLIPDHADIATLRYSRCGRTDKGVSALGQVVGRRGKRETVERWAGFSLGAAES